MLLYAFLYLLSGLIVSGIFSALRDEQNKAATVLYILAFPLVLAYAVWVVAHVLTTYFMGAE